MMTTTTSTARSTVRLHRPALAVAGAAVVLALVLSAVLALRDSGSTDGPAIAPRATTVVGTADALERSAATPDALTQTVTADALERRSAAEASPEDGDTYGSSDAAERWTAP